MRLGIIISWMFWIGLFITGETVIKVSFITIIVAADAGLPLAQEVPATIILTM